jgi:hypothetical protein
MNRQLPAIGFPFPAARQASSGAANAPILNPGEPLSAYLGVELALEWGAKLA